MAVAVQILLYTLDPLCDSKTGRKEALSDYLQTAIFERDLRIFFERVMELREFIGFHHWQLGYVGLCSGK
jgi:hypothetical protein